MPSKAVCTLNPNDYGRCYISETSRLLEVRIKEYKYNMTQGLLENQNYLNMHMKKATKYVERSEGLADLTKNTYRKYKESVNMSLVAHPISQPSLDISPIWTPIIVAEVRKLQLCPV
jgi:hypothetical protein